MFESNNGESMNINEISITGTVAREPTWVPLNGNAIIYFDLAHQKSAVEIELYRCFAIGDLAMNLKKLAKNDFIFIKGNVSSYSPDPNNTGKTRSYFEIECRQIVRCEYLAAERKTNLFITKEPQS